MDGKATTFDIEVLRANEGFVRAVARALVHDDHLADDVVQETFLASVRRGAAPTGAVRAWLRRVATHVALRTRRDAGRRDRRERSAARPEATASASEILEREGARRRMVEAVLGVEEPYRSTLILRYYEDLPPRDIALRTETPVETVRTRLKRGLERVRSRLDAEHGGNRAAWCGPLLGLLGAPMAAATSVVPVSLAAGAAAAAIVVVVWLAWPVDERDAAPAPKSRESTRVATPAPAPRFASASPAQAPALEPVPVAATTASVGSVEVTVTWGADGEAAADVVVGLQSIGGRTTEGTLGQRVGRTDAAGRVRFEGVRAGRVVIGCERDTTKWIELEAGANETVSLAISPFMVVEGRAEDATGAPIEGADVWVSDCGLGDAGEFVARSGPDGSFRIRCGGTFRSIGARAEGHAPSRRYELRASGPEPIPVTLRLGGTGGEIRGRVTDEAGTPLPNAAVILAARETGSRPTYSLGESSWQTRANEVGAFRFPGVDPGTATVWARAPGLAPASARVEVEPGVIGEAMVRLPASAAVFGRVLSREGGAIRDAVVRYADQHQGVPMFVGSSATTDGEGRFRLTGLPSGDLEIRAGALDFVKEAATLTLAPGQELEWDFALARPVLAGAITGRLVDERGAPLPRFRIDARPSTEPRLGQTDTKTQREGYTDEAGRFTIADCAAPLYRLHLTGLGYSDAAFVEGVSPGPDDVLITVTDEHLPTVFVEGRVLDPDGNVIDVANQTWVRVQHPGGGRSHGVDDASGRFRMGPFPPGRVAFTTGSRAHPMHDAGARDLAKGETWDVGTIRLERASALVVSVRRAAGIATNDVGVLLRVGDVEQLPGMDRSLGSVGERAGDEVKFAPLAAGRYAVCIGGRGVAASRVDVEVAPAEETRVEVAAARGVEVTFELGSLDLAAPPGEEGYASFVLMLRDEAGRTIAEGHYGFKGASFPRIVQSLHPGRYEAAIAVRRGSTVSARFDVPASGPAPIVPGSSFR